MPPVDQDNSTRPTPRLELIDITKRFPGTVANDRVSLALMPGEIHALLGENGAGKSTLVKILYGLLHADAGTIRWQGEVVRIAAPAQARKLGIGMVSQHFSLFDSLTVAENIALGLDERMAMLAPDQPVLTNHGVAPCSRILSARSSAYFAGCHTRNGPPKQGENVASGSVTPTSVPATLAV